MKMFPTPSAALLMPRQTARAWLTRHAAVDHWVTRATVWMIFAVMIMNRR
jgi:hypothetical protein